MAGGTNQISKTRREATNLESKTSCHKTAKELQNKRGSQANRNTYFSNPTKQTRNHYFIGSANFNHIITEICLKEGSCGIYFS